MSKNNKRKNGKVSNSGIVQNVDTKKNNVETEERFEFCKKRLELAGIITTIVVIVYQIVNYIHNLNYQTYCETFYNVPKKYFEDSIDKQLLYIALIILLLIFGIVPIMLRKNEQKRGVKTRGFLVYLFFLAAFMGLVIGFVNVLNLDIIVNRGINLSIFAWINNHANFSVILVVLFWIITLICMLFISEIKNIKYKMIKGSIIIIFFISSTISLLIMVFGTIYKLEIQVQNKTEYEFAEKNNEKYIVITEYNSKNIVMKYRVEGDKYILDTGKYYFVGDEAVYSYEELQYAPIGTNEKNE